MASIAHVLSRKAGSCKAQELRSLKWSEINLCMSLVNVKDVVFFFFVSRGLFYNDIDKLSLAKR